MSLEFLCIPSDTSIAELVKEVTDSDEFLDSLRCQQGKNNIVLILGANKEN